MVEQAEVEGRIDPPRLVESTGNVGNGNGFVLRTAVRNQVLQFGSRQFTAREMYEALHNKYPEYVGEERKASISATLANLTSMGELTKTTDGQRKVRFIAAGIEPAIEL